MQNIKLAGLELTFYRTCRVPRGKGLVNSLPAGVGTFPTYRVNDFKKAPEHWKREGHFLPMYPQEAMWIGFGRTIADPVALLVGAGMVNAVTGKKLEPKLEGGDKQNYLCVPPQPWLDGFKRTEGESVYQFVAAELGKGETAEEQILGTAEFGGLQIGVHTPKIKLIKASRPREYLESGAYESLGTMSRGGRMYAASAGPRDMGLGAGGAISQKIYPDPYLQDRSVTEVWSDEPTEKAYIYIVHALDFEAITGQKPPATPITYEFYQSKGYPWFALPDGKWGDVEGSEVIDKLKPVSGSPDPVNAGVSKPNPANEKLW